MPIIKTKKGLEIVVDEQDFEALSAFNWCLNGWGYAGRGVRLADGRMVGLLMHRQILGLSYGDGQYVDHINGNKLDNRRENLRICTFAENMQNRCANANNASGYKGVSFHRRAGKYRAKIVAHGAERYLGLFDTAELAHEAYCLAADLLHGEFARH